MYNVNVSKFLFLEIPKRRVSIADVARAESPKRKGILHHVLSPFVEHASYGTEKGKFHTGVVLSTGAVSMCL